MDTKKIQLGMPFGTANNRLKKIIMFDLVCKLDQNSCFQCKKPMTLENFSIEHKAAWQHNNSELFWDLNNIAFSHLVCNVMAAKKRVLTHCKRGHEFTKENTRIQGKSRVCKKCKLEAWHKGNKKRY
jgi:hypothetical protein